MCTNTPGSFVCECRAEFIKDGASGKCIPFVKSEGSGAAANDEGAGEVQPGQQANPADGIATEGADDTMAANDEGAGEVQPGQQANPADGIATEGADDTMAADGSAQHEEL
jgi:hypothetical protein